MGHRLINFLSKVLPTHHHFNSKRPEHTRLRVKIQHDLMTVKEQVEDLAFNLDKAFYREQMELEGMEYVISPDRKSRLEKMKERKKRVTFNLHSEMIYFKPDLVDDGDDEYEVADSGEVDDMFMANGHVNTSMDESDLAVWEERDPDFPEIQADLSFSDDENSSSFETSFAMLNGTSNDGQSIDHADAFDFGFVQKKDPTDNEVLNFFKGDDDGWQHFTDSTADEMQWPDDITANIDEGGFPSINMTEDPGSPCSIEKDQDITTSTTASTDVSSNEHDHNFPAHDEDSASESSDSESDGSDVSYVDETQDCGFPPRHESFLEKIERENFCRPIEELHENDDDSAQDSWAASDSIANEVTNDKSNVMDDPLPQPMYDIPSSVSNSIIVNHDELESSIDGVAKKVEQDLDIEQSHVNQNESSVQMKSESLDTEVRKTTSEIQHVAAEDPIIAFRESDKDFENSDQIDVQEKDESLNYSQSFLDFSYSSSKCNSKNHLSFSVNEWDLSELEQSSESIPAPDDCVFENSQIIAESPSFDYISSDDDEDSEHDEFLRSVSEEFSDDSQNEDGNSDVSGDGKTFVTQSTAENTDQTNDDNIALQESSPIQGESVLGITKRDTYIPTIDSPKYKGKELGEELDYLEGKMKVLKVKQDCSQNEDILTERPNTLDEDRDRKETSSGTTSYFRSRRNPTAARLKVLRQSKAWKRRYGGSM